jgi:CRP-like cAMP-binding protein
LLCEAGQHPESVYFPSGAVISVVALLKDGRSFETSSIGFEGVAGLLPALTEIAPVTRMFVQIAGGAMKLSAAKLRERADESPTLMRLILLHAQINASQAEQTVACNASHHLPERLARWLLISHDRVDSATMLLTQDYLAVMTGAVRSSVSQTANAMKQAGLIDYSRGRLQILDRAGLERRACECYAIDRANRASLFATA